MSDDEEIRSAMLAVCRAQGSDAIDGKSAKANTTTGIFYWLGASGEKAREMLCLLAAKMCRIIKRAA